MCFVVICLFFLNELFQKILLHVLEWQTFWIQIGTDIYELSSRSSKINSCGGGWRAKARREELPVFQELTG